MNQSFRRESNGCLCSRPNMGVLLTSKEMETKSLANRRGFDNQRTKKR